MTLFSSFHNFSSKKGAGPSRICLLLSACAGLPLLAEESRSTETGAAIELPRLVVDASKGGEEESYNANVGTLGAINIKDAPFSISVLDSGETSRLQATSASEAFRYTPSVHPMLGTNRASDYFLIRGFNNSPLSGDGGAVDGLRTYTLVNPLEDKERLEVIDGPASLLFGMSSPSGMVNYVLKRPTNTPFSSFQLGVSGGRQVYGHADLGGPLDEQHRFGYRLNFLWTGKGSMAVPGQTHKRYLLSGAFDYHLDRQTTLSLDVSRFAREYEDCQAIFLIGSTTITKLPHAPDPSKNYGAPYGYGQDDYLRAGLGSSSRFGKDTSVRTRLTYVIDDNKSPNYRDNFINNQGDYTAVIYDKGLHRTETTQANAFVETVFETGSIEHKLNAGLVGDYVRYLNPFGKPTATYNSSGFLSSLSLSNPAYAPLSSFGTLDVTSGAPYNNT